MDFIRINAMNNSYFNEAMELYKISFPIYEQRTLKDQIEVLEDSNYYYMVICEDSKLVGILLYWEVATFTYIEHLTITPNLRGKNYGTKVLQAFCKANKTIILEIDPPTEELSIKRLHFYSKLGFKLQQFEHIHAPYRKGYAGHELKIMSFNKDLSMNEYDLFNKFLKEQVMNYSEYPSVDKIVKRI